MKKIFSKKGILLLGGGLMIIASAVIININNLNQEGCTTWVALGDSLENENTILHKNRDANPSTMNVHEVENGTAYKYLAVTDTETDLDAISVWGGINEVGVAAASNFVPGTYWFGPYKGGDAVREILENASTVQEAYDWIYANRSKFMNGNLIFIADKDIAAVVEVKQKYNWFGFPNGIKVTTWAESVVDGVNTTTSGKPDVNFGTNHYNIFGNLLSPTSSSLGRYARLTELLTNAPTDDPSGYYGEIDLENTNAISRLEAESEEDNAICIKAEDEDNVLETRTVAGITIEIDEADPLDSKLWFANGYPCENEYTLYEFSEN